MATTVNEVMTADPRTVDGDDTLVHAAREMREGDVGALVVTDRGRVSGILTDRDIVVRAVAEGRPPAQTRVAEVCTTRPVTLTPDQSLDDAIRLMREHGIRRIPVVQDDRAAGILSLGDAAVEREPGSPLGEISAAAPNG